MTPQIKSLPDALVVHADHGVVPPVQEWLDIVDLALHGIHHSLNNRIGALLAALDLHQSGALADVGGLEGLVSEVERLQVCNRVIRLLPDSAAGEEAFDIRDVLADAVVIHEILPAHKEVPVVVADAVGTPVRAERWAVMRALTLLLRGAKWAAAAPGSTATSVHASIHADDSSVRVTFRLAGATAGAVGIAGAPSHYAELLAERFGGVATVAPGAFELRMPTLRARRAAAVR